MSAIMKKMKNTSRRRVFRNPKSSKRRPIRRQLLESILMLVVGIYLLNFLNSIPNRLAWVSNIDEVWSNMLNGIFIIINSCLIFGSGILVITGIIFGTLLVFGGSIRLLRIISFVLITFSKSLSSIQYLLGTSS